MVKITLSLMVLFSCAFAFAHGAHEDLEEGWIGYFALGNPSYFESNNEGHILWVKERNKKFWEFFSSKKYWMHFHVRNSGQAGAGTLLQPVYLLNEEEYQQLLHNLVNNESSVDLEAWWNEIHPKSYMD